MTNKTITSYELVLSLNNTKSLNKPAFKNKAGKTSASTICRGQNLSILGGKHFVPFIAVNPIQTNNRPDTPVYEVYSDGTRRKINTKSFFSALVLEKWIELKVDLEMDLEDLDEELWGELEDRCNIIKLVVDASSVEAFNQSFDLGYAKSNKNGKLIRHMTFKGAIAFDKGKVNINPLRLKAIPSFLTDDEYEAQNEEPVKVANQAAKAAASSSILKQEIAKEEVEEIVVSEEEMTAGDCEEVNALFADSQSSAELFW